MRRDFAFGLLKRGLSLSEQLEPGFIALAGTNDESEADVLATSLCDEYSESVHTRWVTVA